MSIPRLNSNRGLSVLGGVCAALALLVVVELIARPSVEPIEPAALPSPIAKAESGVQGVPAMPPLAEFSAVVERNLFSETRRVRESDGETGTSAVLAIDAQLVGIVIADDNDPVALFRVSGSNEFLRVTKGQSVRGRRVAAVLPDRVVLQGDEPNEIKLHESEAAGATPDLGKPQPVRARPTPAPPAAGSAPSRGAPDRSRARR